MQGVSVDRSLELLDQFRRSFLSVSVFVHRAYSAHKALTAQEIRSRSAEGSKELIEEILPLAAFLKHFEVPNRNVRCKFKGGSEEYDAEIRIFGPEVERGYLSSHYFVEVTTATSPVDYLEREALNRYGHVWHDPDIHRSGSRRKGNDQILNQPTVLDDKHEVRNAISWVKERIHSKSNKIYPKPCILIINAIPEWPPSLEEWCYLKSQIESFIDREKFERTYVVNSSKNFVFEI